MRSVALGARGFEDAGDERLPIISPLRLADRLTALNREDPRKICLNLAFVSAALGAAFLDDALEVGGGQIAHGPTIHHCRAARSATRNPMPRYVALLRGINVGGNNLVRMVDLKRCVEEAGFRDVATYIQSGNVVFGLPRALASAKITGRIERALEDRFGVLISVVVRSLDELTSIVTSAPSGFGAQPAAYRYDVIFVKEPATPKDVLAVAPVNPVVDAVTAGPHVLYYSRLIEKASQSRLSKLIALPIYKSVTIRNWNTTTKLLAMLERAT